MTMNEIQNNLYNTYYSNAFQTLDAVQATIDALREQAVFVTDAFQIYTEIGVDPETMVPIFETDGSWYFNARSTEALTGDWIGPTPSSPARVWA